MNEANNQGLTALIEMDPLSAIQEGKTGLDMLKNLTSELAKAKQGKCSHLNPDGTFKGGFEGCVAHFRTCKGLPEPNAKRMCAYIGRKAGKIPGGTKKSLLSVSETEIADILLPVATNDYDDEDAMVKAMDDALSKALAQEEEEEDEGLGAGGKGRAGKPKSEEERQKTHKKKFGTQEVPPKGTGLQMLRSVNSDLAKAMEITATPKGVSFEIKGDKIQAGIANKVAELNQKVTKLIARHPNCNVDDETEDYPEVVKTSSDIMTNVPEMSGAQCPNRQEHWQIRSLRRRIDSLQRVSRNLDSKKTFSLTHWDLEEYGL